MANSHKINWVNTLFLTLIPIIGIAGTALLCVFGIVQWPTWILAGAMTILVGFSITGGYHRLFSHRSYRCKWPVRLFYLLFGSAAFEGSVLEWSTDHRNHHRYVDTDEDPYSIKKGFWFAHIGWLIRLEPSKRDFSNVADLAEDPLVRFQHKFVVPLGILFAFLLPTAIASLWGDPLGGLIIAGALRVTFNHHTTFAINSICHMFGKKSYSNEQTAVDNWFTALLTFGEGYHNFHHKFPIDYRNGIKAYHFDPTKWLIKLLAYLGLATDLKVVSKRRIIRQQIIAKEQLIQEKINKRQLANASIEYRIEVFEGVRQSTQQLLSKIEQLEQHYRSLIQNKMKCCSRKERKPYRAQLKTYRKHIKSAYLELGTYMNIWHQLYRQWHSVPA